MSEGRHWYPTRWTLRVNISSICCSDVCVVLVQYMVTVLYSGSVRGAGLSDQQSVPRHRRQCEAYSQYSCVQSVQLYTVCTAGCRRQCLLSARLPCSNTAVTAGFPPLQCVAVVTVVWGHCARPTTTTCPPPAPLPASPVQCSCCVGVE